MAPRAVNRRLNALLSLVPAERRLGPYALLRELGRGGFAPVWLGRDLGEQPVAIKLFDIEEPEALAAVEQEAQALGLVRHPAVVRYIGLEVDKERGVAGLVMEFAAGLSVADMLASGRGLPHGQVCAIGAAVASALDAVHRVGLVHRDVKPANIVEADGAYKLVDFGIAIASGPQPPGPGAAGHEARQPVVIDDLPLSTLGSNQSLLLRARSEGGPRALSSGTLGYVDPECVAFGVPAVPASDLYSLGATLFECCTGKLPAVAAAPQGQGLAGEVLDGRKKSPPLPRDVWPSAPAAHHSLPALIEALLEPKRSARPGHAEDVSRVLQGQRSVRDVVPPAASRGAAFLAVNSPGGAQKVSLRATNSLGRHPKNSIQLLDKIASKEHCIIEERGAHFVLCDLGSLNGTYVNHERVNGEQVLHAGDLISIGSTQIEFGYDQDPLAPAPGQAALAASPPAPPMPAAAPAPLGAPIAFGAPPPPGRLPAPGARPAPLALTQANENAPPPSAPKPAPDVAVRGYLVAGRYFIEHPLVDDGGQASVWSAFNAVTQHSVRLELIPAAAAPRKDAWARLRREASRLAPAGRRVVVPVLDVIEDPWTGAALVFDMMLGHDLGEHQEAAGGSLPLNELQNLVKQGLDALATVHELGVALGWLDPRSLALHNAPGAPSRWALRLPGRSAGRLLKSVRDDWVAPEQAGAGRDASPQADVYAFGQIVRGALRDRSDQGIEQWLERACDPDPSRRFPDARAALRAWRDP